MTHDHDNTAIPTPDDPASVPDSLTYLHACAKVVDNPDATVQIAFDIVSAFTVRDPYTSRDLRYLLQDECRRSISLATDVPYKVDDPVQVVARFAAQVLNTMNLR